MKLFLAYLITYAQAGGIDIPRSDVNLPDATLEKATIDTALQLVFGLGGAIALLIVTIAGFKYVISQGDPQNTAKAKNAIIGALIGLIICAIALSIVTFVVKKV